VIVNYPLIETKQSVTDLIATHSNVKIVLRNPGNFAGIRKLKMFGKLSLLIAKNLARTGNTVS